MASILSTENIIKMSHFIYRILYKLRLFSDDTFYELQRHAHLRKMGPDEKLIYKTKLFDLDFYFEALRSSKSEIFGVSGVQKIIDTDRYGLHLLSSNADQVILDIGSHIGIFPRHVQQKLPEAKIISIEPDPNNFEILEMNNGVISNAEAIWGGVLDSEGTMALKTSKRNSWRSVVGAKSEYLNSDYVDNDKFDYCEYSVPVFTIDHLVGQKCKVKVDLMGITVPGQIALKILYGGKNTIKRYKPQISIDLYENEVDEVSDYLNRFGYELVKRDHTTMHIFKCSDRSIK